MNKRLCLCGCGQYVFGVKRFVSGHKKIWEANWNKLCECGCGEVTKPDKRFIFSHDKRGTHRTTETKQKIREANLGKPSAMKGKHHTFETRRQISLSKMGHTVSSEARKKMSISHTGKPNPMKGKHVSPESLEKNREAQLLPETRKKKSESRSGSKAYNYKNGKGAWNKKLHPRLSLFEYRDLEGQVRRRDSYKCQISGKDLVHTSRLNVHHIVPVSIGFGSSLCDCKSNLITICAGCHRRLHDNQYTIDKWKKLIPFAKTYLSQFKYKKLLLNDYI